MPTAKNYVWDGYGLKYWENAKVLLHLKRKKVVHWESRNESLGIEKFKNVKPLFAFLNDLESIRVGFSWWWVTAWKNCRRQFNINPVYNLCKDADRAGNSDLWNFKFKGEVISGSWGLVIEKN